MGYGIKVRVWGDYACFTRPEMKVERVSYDMLTPSAARGIIEAIYWKPAIKWSIDKIHVINPIKFTNIRRNEVSEVAKLGNIKKAMDKGETYQIIATDNRHQRAALILRDVEYVIEAHFDLNPDNAGVSDTVEKHYNIVMRRLKNGQFFYQPTLGTREFAASFELIEHEADIPKSNISGELDLGYMLYDMNFSVDKKKIKQTVNPSFFRVKLKDGILDLQNAGNEVRV